MNPKDQPPIFGRSMKIVRLNDDGCVDPNAPVVPGGPFTLNLDFKIDPPAWHAYMRMVLGEDTTWQYKNWNRLVSPRITRWQDRWHGVGNLRREAWARIRIAARILRYGP